MVLKKNLKGSDEVESRFYWLKLKRDFFKRHDIQIIENMENGKDYILFYLKLLCESVDHEGNLRFSEEIPYNENMLSTITNTNIDIVRSAIKIFSELGMMEILDDGTYFMNEVNRMIGSAVDNDNANRQRRFRERRKQEISHENDANVTQTLLDCYESVTKNNESKSKSKSKSKSIDNKSVSKDTECAKQVLQRNQNRQTVIDYWNKILVPLGINPVRKIITDSITDKMLQKRIVDYGLDEVLATIDLVAKSDFLIGRIKEFVITFDWFIKPNNFQKIFNGNYNENKNTKHSDDFNLEEWANG